VGAGPAAAPVLLGDIDGWDSRPRPTGVGEFDRVLGGGLVPGSVTLVGGEPGIGKSTLLLQALAALSGDGARALLVSAEESPHQVKRRAERLGVSAEGVWIVAETSMPAIRTAIDKIGPDILVVDSIQTVWDPELESAPGSVTQVRGCAHQLVTLAKGTGLTTVLVGHVTKDGSLAGPRVLEHVVDTVATFEGERHHSLRLLRASKHRFGPTGELGVFEMTDAGLVGVHDASGMFLADRRMATAGSAVFPAVEGRRPLLVELQALVVPSSFGTPRRSASGFDAGRLALLIAVLHRHAHISVQGFDVYASAAGGARISEPGADLAVCLAIASATLDRPLPDDLVVIGEVGLAGELRQVGQTPRRLDEAARLGFARALVPVSSPEAALPTVTAGSLAEAVGLVVGVPPPAAASSAATNNTAAGRRCTE
jgi:DNA repair protein RadA/Sms